MPKHVFIAKTALAAAAKAHHCLHSTALQPQVAYTATARIASKKIQLGKSGWRDSPVNLTSPLAKAQLNIFLDTDLPAANLPAGVKLPQRGAKMQKRG